MILLSITRGSLNIEHKLISPMTIIVYEDWTKVGVFRVPESRIQQSFLVALRALRLGVVGATIQ